MNSRNNKILETNKTIWYHPKRLSEHFANFFDYFEYEYDYQWKISKINPVTQFFNNTKEDLD